MCGICGKVLFDRESKASASIVKVMADTIRHRGPDDDGFYICNQVGLGFRRLSIIDLSGGHQPLSNEDGTVWIVFNGEIYNYRDLRNELLAKGHVFKTKSDTEVIVHLYEEYGVDCVQKLRGMFAFAIWNSAKRFLLLARDRVGIKPLYYYVDEHFLSFGSEIKALLADPAVTREVDPEIIDRFLTYYYVPGAQTILRKVFKLQPGHVLTVRDGKVQIRRYWDLNFSGTDDNHASSKGLERELVKLLDETVQIHMISDVPLGFLLSGGVDSTAMLSFAARKTDKPISTYTIGFSSQSVIDERPFARIAARTFGSDHHEISMSPDDFVAFMPNYVWHMEEPVCQPPAVALYYVSKLASRYVKVLISGEGADEAFAGYENYRNLFWFESIKKALGPLRELVGQGMIQLSHVFKSRVLAKYSPLMGMDLNQYYLSRTSSPFQFFNRDISELYSRDMVYRVSKDRSMDVVRNYLVKGTRYGLLDQMLYVDTKTWLPDELLIKADKMTMANSVELRVPFLDHRVLEFAARLPRNQKVRGWRMKYLLKRALKTHVPDEILRRQKAGFPVPYAAWLRCDLKEWVHAVLLDRKSISRGYFQRSAIEGVIQRNLKHGGYSQEIFSLLVLELWHRAFADQGSSVSHHREAPVSADA